VDESLRAARDDDVAARRDEGDGPVLLERERRVDGLAPTRRRPSTPLRVGATEAGPALAADFEKRGVEPWARESMGGRLGSDFPPEGVEWWTKFMGQTAVSTQVGFMKTIACADIRADLPKIACPTLVITTERSRLASVEETTTWQRMIPLSELVVLPGNSYHAAASHPVECARATLAFMERRSAWA